MKRSVYHMLRLIGAAVWMAAGLASAGQSVRDEERKLLVGTEQFEAKARVEANRLEFELPAPREQRVINLKPELLAKLNLAPERNYDVLASQRQTPGGLAAGVRFKDDRGLYAIAESIRDLPLLKPSERDGIRIEQLPTESRTLVYEDSCKIVYNVPTAFTIDDQRIVLQAFESKNVKIQNANFALTLDGSRFVVLKDCPTPFEGGQSQVDYTLVRQ
jgi:hypothetical protein